MSNALQCDTAPTLAIRTVIINNLLFKNWKCVNHK